MVVCHIWDADYPWDIRVEKVSLSLIRAGHSVNLVCRNQARRPRIEANGKFIIRRLPSVPSVFGEIHTLCNFPFPFNPVWIRAISQVICDTRANLILVRDLPLALPAAILGKIHRVPVVFDMAEHYPAMLEDRLRYTPTGFLGRLVRSPSMARFIERLAIRLVDHILVVVEESRERLIQAGVPSESISVVSNTPKEGLWNVSDLAKFEAERPSNNGIGLVYLGNLDGIRGIDIAIQAIRYLKDQKCVAKLTVIGNGPSLPYLRRLADQLEVADQVIFKGHLSLNNPIESAQLQSIMARSHIGLIPHYATEACHATIPNKLFDYMSMGLPVIVSNMRPTARVVIQEGCGEVFHDRDATDLARCVQVLADPQIRSIKGANGVAAIRKRYHWGYDSEILVKTIESVASQFKAKVA